VSLQALVATIRASTIWLHAPRAHRLRLGQRGRGHSQTPHPLESIGFSFVDRRSEAWLEQAALTPETLTALIKVFANLRPGRLHLRARWCSSAAPAIRRGLCAIASPRCATGPARGAHAHRVGQCDGASVGGVAGLGRAAYARTRRSAGLGHRCLALDCRLAGCASAVAGRAILPPFVAATEDEAIAALPANIQTLGVALSGTLLA